jgi:tetratricopeptide (TPR) repeat protein
MKWLVEIFKAKPARQTERDFFDACDAFMKGKEIWHEASLINGEGWRESKLLKIQQALRLFDKAIEKGLKGRNETEIFSGFDESEVYALRGHCLNDLGYYFEALEDFNLAITKHPRKGIASNYHIRSLIKDSLFDFDGSLADIKEAIRLSKLDNDDNAYWNNYAKSTGFASATAFYELACPTQENILRKKKAYSGKEIEEKLKEIKRRMP